MKIVYENGTGEIEEKKSRFIANVYKVETEDEAIEIISRTKKQYWDARHNCYAYVLGEKSEIQRFSDDGEPQGTAGKPILEVITHGKLYNCLIVVTRYFGGTLLGTGGLIRAYQAASKAGIEGSVILEVSDGFLAELECDYTSIGKIQYVCAEMQIDILDTQYTDSVRMQFIIHNEKYEQFDKKITDVFSGKIAIVKIRQQKFGKSDNGRIVCI